LTLPTRRLAPPREAWLSADGPDIFERRESRARSYSRRIPIEIATASGSLVQDCAGREYIDFLSAAGSLNYGHNDPDLREALIDYIRRDGVAASLDLFTAAKREFLEVFSATVLAPRDWDHVVQFTGPTGTNAVEAALKLARTVTGRSNVIAFTNGFHGVTLGALAATGNSLHRSAAAGCLQNVTRAPYDGYLGAYDTVEYLQRLLTDSSSGVDPPAAFLLEVVQGEGGLNVAGGAWLRRLAELATEHGALLVVDEVQTGCGRLGSFLGVDAAGVVPDIVALSKSLSGYGLPLSVLLIKPEFDVWEPGQHNGTFRGNNHAFVTARAALQKFWSDDSFAIDMGTRELQFERHVRRIAQSVAGARPKGAGWMRGIDFGTGVLAREVQQRCLDSGLILETAGPNDSVVKLLPPLTTPLEILEKGLGVLAESVADAAATRDAAL